jgi:hypothetical protein
MATIFKERGMSGGDRDECASDRSHIECRIEVRCVECRTKVFLM